MTTKPKCRHVTGHRWGREQFCRNPAGHGPDGAYCKQHDPEAIAAKRAARDAKWKAERLEGQRQRKQAAARAVFLDQCERYVRSLAVGMTDPNGNEARRIIADYEEARK